MGLQSSRLEHSARPHAGGWAPILCDKSVTAGENPHAALTQLRGISPLSIAAPLLPPSRALLRHPSRFAMISRSRTDPKKCHEKCQRSAKAFYAGKLLEKVGDAPLAQLDRASVYGTEGWWFEPTGVY